MRLFVPALFLVTMLVQPSRAQEHNYIGAYNGSQPEMAFHIYILPENDFILSMSYGAVDQLIIGKWKILENEISLEESPEIKNDVFLVYQAKTNAKQRSFSFHNFDQQTAASFAILKNFNPDSLMYIHHPYENVFTRTNLLTAAADRNDPFFLSCPLTDERHEIYEFRLSEGYDQALVFYQPAPQAPFKVKAMLQDGVLTIKDHEGNLRNAGSKQELPADYKNLLKEANAMKAFPDKMEKSINGTEVTFDRIQPVRKFEEQLNLNASKAYFGTTGE